MKTFTETVNQITNWRIDLYREADYVHDETNTKIICRWRYVVEPRTVFIKDKKSYVSYISFEDALNKALADRKKDEKAF